jgi:fermentation-respiration switch protein FrsA (DUF1100 family)
MPVLILQGTSDLQVPEDEAKRWPRRAEGPAGDRAGHEPPAENRRRRRGAQQKSYASPDLPVAPQLIDALAGFIK